MAGPGHAVANMRIRVDCQYFFSNVSVSLFLVDLLEYNLLAMLFAAADTAPPGSL